MNRAENITKWAIAIIVIFGLITTFYILQWGTVLKVSLIVLAISLIGLVLLQSGKGGGLAAIGGLSDQSMMGTQTGTILGKTTYLVGGAVLVSIIMLSKLSVAPRIEMRPPAGISMEVPGEMHTDHDGHDHAKESAQKTTEADSSVGMQDLPVSKPIDQSAPADK